MIQTNNSNVHIIRGGSWDDIPEYCRSTDRSNGDILNLSIGFRVVCVPNVTSTQLPIATVTSTPLPKVVPTPLTNFTENLPKGITLEMVGLPTLTDILTELEKPGRDPRQTFEVFSFTEGVKDFGELCWASTVTRQRIRLSKSVGFPSGQSSNKSSGSVHLQFLVSFDPGDPYLTELKQKLRLLI